MGFHFYRYRIQNIRMVQVLWMRETEKPPAVKVLLREDGVVMDDVRDRRDVDHRTSHKHQSSWHWTRLRVAHNDSLTHKSACDSIDAPGTPPGGHRRRLPQIQQPNLAEALFSPLSLEVAHYWMRYVTSPLKILRLQPTWTAPKTRSWLRRTRTDFSSTFTTTRL